MPDFNRRTLLRSAAALGAGVIAGQAFAAPAAGSRLLLVFLRGAYDATNIIAPTGSAFYQEARPTLALPRPDPANPDAALPLDADWSLHPALAKSIWPLWQKRQVAFIPFAGTDDMSRSHFETQDNIEMGQPLAAARSSRSGFLGRLAAALGDRDAIAFTQALPLIFRGGPAIPNIAVGSNASPRLDDRQSAMIAQLYQGQQIAGVALDQQVAEGFAARDKVYTTIRAEMASAGRGAISARGFELAARRIGMLMRQQYNLAFVDVGGWDTHVGQGGAQGYLAGRIGELGRGLAGFVEEIGPEAWQSTTVVVLSEFGRTFRENGSRGTDHGHGSTYWVLGGGVDGGRIAGAQVGLAPDTLNQNRDLPVLSDFRALIGGLVARQYGLSRERLATVFPAATPLNLRLL